MRFVILSVALSFVCFNAAHASDNAWRTVELFRQIEKELGIVAMHDCADGPDAQREIQRLSDWLREGQTHLNAGRVSAAAAMAERLNLQRLLVRAVLEWESRQQGIAEKEAALQALRQQIRARQKRLEELLQLPKPDSAIPAP